MKNLFIILVLCCGILFFGDSAVTGNFIVLDVNELCDSIGNPTPLTAGGTEINAIPAPATAWLLGSGLIGLVGICSRHRS